jgi:HPr kinase/phosphorylase
MSGAAPSKNPQSVHANAIVIAEQGVLIRGPSGAGKSALSLALIEAASLTGRFAALVADDRVRLSATNGRLIARGVAGFEGRIERRGAGIVTTRRESAVVIRLVVDLAPRGQRLPRWPEPGRETATILGVQAPRVDLDLTTGLAAGALHVLNQLPRPSGEVVSGLLISLDHCAAVHKNMTNDADG